MAPRKPRRPSSRAFTLVREAFTLVELLVVIGIIVVLVGILLPVIGGVRKRAWATSSQAAIMKLADAMERYHQDFNAYPGILSNSAFDTPTGCATAPGLGSKFTMTENAVLALVGGLNPSPSQAYVPAEVGKGPMGQSTIASQRKRYAAYIEATPGSNLQRTSPAGADLWSRPGVSIDDNGAYSSDDSANIPEFMDQFPDPMPILIIRARSGAPSFVTGSGSTNDPKMGTTPQIATQYNVNWLLPYANKRSGVGPGKFPESSEDTNNNGQLDASEDTNGNGRLDYDFSADNGTTGSPGVYFRNPGVPTEVRQKDGYWLIGAGPDRKYGTKDDQTNFGPL